MMATSWYRAPALTVLLNEINLVWPDRSKVSDGTIGDAAHSARLSDHNPNERRSVNAIDVTRRGIAVMILILKVIADPRTNYVIYNRVIWSWSRGFKPRPYYGSNAHTGHVHISIFQSERRETDRSPWGLVTPAGLPTTGAAGPTPSTPTTPKEDTLSAKEVEGIKAEVWAAAKALQDQGFDRKIRDVMALETARAVAMNGFDRPVLESIGEAAARQTLAKVSGMIAANRKLLEDIQSAGGISDSMMDAMAERAEAATFKGSKEGVEAGSAALTNQLTAALTEVLSDLVWDLGKDLDEDIVKEITETVVAELTTRLNKEGK